MEITTKVTKLQSGGGMPAFVSYTNVPQPMPAAPSSQGVAAPQEAATTEAKTGGIDKSLLQALYKEGLISDTDAVANEVSSLFSNQNNPLDPNATATSYRKALMLMARLREGKEQWKSAVDESKKNGAYGEMAVSTDGRYYVMGEQGPTLKEHLEQGDHVLTNADLAELRANSVPFANNISTVIANGVSMEQINKTVWDLIAKIGKDSESKEFFTTKKGKDIKEGLEELIGAGEDGVYKVTSENTDQTRKAKVALTYLLSTMPTNAKALLRGKASLAGLDPTKGAFEMLAGMVSAGLDSDSKVSIAYDKAATNGANTDSEGNKKTMAIKPTMSYYMGENGVESTFILNPGQGNEMHADSVIYGTPMGQDGKLIEQGSLETMLNKGIGGIVDRTSIYLGNQKLDSSNTNQVLYDGTQLARTIMPFKRNTDGSISPDFEMAPKFVEAQKEIRERGANITTAEIQQILMANDLEGAMTQNAKGELVWNQARFMPFLMTNVYASGEDPYFSKKKGAIDVDRAGEGYMTNINSVQGVDPDNIKSLFKGKLGIKPEDEIYKAVAYMPLLLNAGLAQNVAGEDPTVPQSWGDMRILKGRAKEAATLSTFNTPNTSKVTD